MSSTFDGCGLSAPLATDFETIVRPHLIALHAIARGIVRSDDLAWDAVQETLLCLWHEPAEPADARAWLVRTVVHKSLHVQRAARRRRHHEREVGLERDESCPLCDPALELEFDESRVELESALRTLSDELRSVLLLRLCDGLEYAEIAQRLALPIGTVRSRLSRARRRLVDHLGLAEPDSNRREFA